MISKFRKKPVVVEAVQFTGHNVQEIQEFTKGKGTGYTVISIWTGEYSKISIGTLEGPITAIPQDWIIKGTKGEFYPCKPDIFAEVYELVMEEK